MLTTLLRLSFVYLATVGGVSGTSPSLQSILGDNSIQIYFPGEPGYADASRAFNLRLDFKPIAVAYPNSTEEVAQLVKAGASLGLPGGDPFLVYLR